MSVSVPTEDDLRRADGLFRRALAEDRVPGALRVLGYGEISTAVAFTTAAGEAIALKRLPPFVLAHERAEAARRVDAYRSLFDEYLAVLAARDVGLVPSTLREIEGSAGEILVFCVQPVLPAESLGPAVVKRLSEAGDDDALARHLRGFFETFRRVADPRVGLDGQLSNWAFGDDGWRYFDVTTPLLRDTSGRDRLDAELFLAMLPRPLRPLVRRFLLRSITQTYFEARSVAIDFLGNLIKERLERALAVGLEVAERLFEPVITESEVRSSYHADARLWELLLKLRRADRFWHRRVRRRVYPFLLPGRIER